ncbi:MAG TPA: hypothetical protein VEZ90_08505 [Blastocatellia bacterium]|nr:hypothetical protein [Blastocatellia bacterium]
MSNLEGLTASKVPSTVADRDGKGPSHEPSTAAPGYPQEAATRLNSSKLGNDKVATGGYFKPNLSVCLAN